MGEQQGQTQRERLSCFDDNNNLGGAPGLVQGCATHVSRTYISITLLPWFKDEKTVTEVKPLAKRHRPDKVNRQLRETACHPGERQAVLVVLRRDRLSSRGPGEETDCPRGPGRRRRSSVYLLVSWEGNTKWACLGCSLSEAAEAGSWGDN